jgi:uncharacterized protein
MSHYAPFLPPPAPKPYPVILPEIKTPWWSERLDYVDIDGNTIPGWGQIVEDADDIDQCINIIIRTPKGSDPFRPEFGMDWLPYLDKPIDRINPYVVREATRSILTWEPRIVVDQIETRILSPEYAHWLIVVVYWHLKNSPYAKQTEVAYALRQ